jgi:N-acetylglucosaminyl-diphospho-decaprenol L-rhamnosyltransferase
MSAAPRTAVLIVTRERRAHVLAALEAVAAFPEASTLSVFVLDHGSRDSTFGAVSAWLAGHGSAFARAECRRAPDNRGAAAGRNRLAAAAAGHEFFFFLDDDAVPEPGCLAAALAAAGADVGIVGLRVVAVDDPTRDLAGAGFVDWRLGRFHERAAAETVDCDFVITCAALVRAEAFRAAGGFDEDYFVYHEDVDFGVRVRRAGYRVRWTPRAAVRHRAAPEDGRAADRLYYLARNKLLFLRKHRPWPRHPLPWLLYGAGLVPALAARALLYGRGGAGLAAVLAGGRDGLLGRTGARR